MSDSQGTAPTEESVHFLTLVNFLFTNAWMAMGKQVNPATGETLRDLAAAKQFIDWLGALETRARPSLSEEEASLLKSSLTNLRLTYVEELKQGDETEATAEAAGAGESAAAPSAEPPHGDRPSILETPAGVSREDRKKPAETEGRVTDRRSSVS